MKADLPRTLLFTATALVAGWGIGFAMRGSQNSGKEPNSRSGVVSNETLRSIEAKAEEQVAKSRIDVAAESISFTPTSGDGPGAQFDALVRGALRITDSTDRLVRLREVARWIKLADLPEAIEKAKRLPYSERWQVMQAIGARWAEEDPAAAAAFAAKQGGNRWGSSELLDGVIDKWASVDLRAALAWVGTQPGGRQLNLIQSLTQSVARRDPAAALDILKTQPGSSQMTWLFHQVFEQWAQRDPAGAARTAEALDPGTTRDRALASVASSWGGQDPAAAAAWAETFPDKAKKNTLLTSMAMAWVEVDPKAVIQWAGNVAEPSLHQNILGAAISKLAQSDLESAKAQLLSIASGQERDNLVVQVTMAVANQDPKTALSLLEMIPAGPQRVNATMSTATQLATIEPELAAKLFLSLPATQISGQISQFVANLATAKIDFAREWVDQIEDGPLRAQAVRSIASVMSRSDPRSAADWLLKIQPSADFGWLFGSWSRNAPKDVLQWAAELPDGEAKRAAQVSVVQSMVWADLEQARTIFTRDLGSEAQISTASNLANQWANRDLGTARAWAESLPPGGTRQNALGGIARSWATQDPVAATQWINQFPAGDERDRVVTQFAGAIVQRDPESAIAWASSIEDPSLRGAQLESLASRWLQTDTTAAKQWITQSELLSQGTRRRILEQRSSGYYYGSSVYFDYSN